MKRTLLILTLLLIAALVAGSLFWLWRDRQIRSFYTDGSRISQRMDEAFVREVLWQPPEALPAILNTDADEYEPRISLDGSTLLLVRGKAGSNADIFLAQRDPATGTWAEPQSLIDINTEHDELGPTLSPDGRTLLFASNRPGSIGGYDLWLSKRTDFGWSQPVNLGPEINSDYNEYGPSLSPDGNLLLFASNRPAAGEAPTRQPGDWSATVRERYAASDYDLYSAIVKPDGFEPAAALSVLNSSTNEGAPAFSPAGDFLYFCSDRSGGAGGFDLYRSRRLDGVQLAPEALGGEINTAGNEMDPAPENGGFALVYSTDRIAPPQPRTGAEDGPARRVETPSYDLWRSESREVFVRVGPRAPLDLAGLWTWLSPLLLWLLLLLLALALLVVSWKGVRSHRLGLLTRCLLASVIAHLILMILLTFWQVTTTLAQMVERGSATRIVLAGDSGRGGLMGQLRGGVSGDLSVAPRETAAAIKADRVEQAPGASPDLVQMAMNRAAAGAEEASRLQASAREADDRHVESPRTDMQTYAALQQPNASEVQVPQDAQRDASSEARAAAQGSEAPRAARSSATPAPTAANASAAQMQPSAAQAGAIEQVRVVAVASESTTANQPTTSQIPQSNQAMQVDPLAASALQLAQPRDGEGQRVASNESSGPSVRGGAQVNASRAATDLSALANGGSGTGAAGGSVAFAPKANGSAGAETPVSVSTGVPGDSASQAVAAVAPSGIALRSSAEIEGAQSHDPSQLALPGEISASGTGTNASEAGAVVSASNASGQRTSRAAAAGATGQPALGDAAGAAVQTAVTSNAGAPEAMGVGGVRSASDSSSDAVASGAAVGTFASSAALDAGAGDASNSAAQLALPGEGATGAVAMGATSQPSIGAPSSALASNAARHNAGGGEGVGDAATGAASVVALAPAAGGNASGADEGASSVVRGSEIARESSAGGAPTAVAPGSDRALGLDDGPSMPAMASGELKVPGEVSNQAGGGTREGETGTGPLIADRTSSGRADRGGGPAGLTSSKSGNAVALAPAAGPNAATGDEGSSSAARGGDVARDAAPSGTSGAAAPGRDRSLGLDDGMPSPALASAELSLPGEGTGATRNGTTNDARVAGPLASGSSIGRAGDDDAPPTFGASAGSISIALSPDRVKGGGGEESRDASPSTVTGAINDADSVSGSNRSPIAAALTNLDLPEAAPGPDLNLRLPAELLPPGNPYAARNEETRMQTVKKMGGSEETEKAVALALDWLARHQSPDGRWATRQFDQGCGQCEGEGKFDTDIATTGLALLCFLGADHTHAKEGKYQANVQRGLAWLASQQMADGDLRGGETMYSHGIASIALAESLGMTNDPRLQDPVRRAVEFIDAARNRNVGGWRYEPRQAGDTSVSGWQVMALMSAKRAGLPPADQAFAAASAWMEKVSTPNRPGRYSYQPAQPHSPSMTAEGMFIQQLLGVPHDDPRMRGSVEYILENLPRWDEAANTYYWYYATLAMFQYQGPAWEKWNEELTRVLLKNQRTSGATSGSWDPQDNWSKIGGRVYQTAICTLCLEVYYRYLPMYKAPMLADARSTVAGSVVDSSTGAPLPGATVRLDMSSGSGALVAVTDADGRYALALPELPADFVALSASMEGYTPATANIAKAETGPAGGGGGAQVVRDFALAPRQSKVIALEQDPQVHHLGNNEFEGAINSQFQKQAEGGAYQAEFTLGAQHLPMRVHKAEVVLMFKGAQAQNTIFINDQRLDTRLRGSPRDGSFGEFRVEIPMDWLHEGVNTVSVRASNSEGDLDDFEFVNVQIQFDATPAPAAAPDAPASP